MVGFRVLKKGRAGQVLIAILLLWFPSSGGGVSRCRYIPGVIRFLFLALLPITRN